MLKIIQRTQILAKEPLNMILSGTAGTGKSLVIHALTKLLGTKCKLLAPTGNAAFNIGGDTATSQLWLPVCGKRYGDIGSKHLKTRIQPLWPKSIKYVIIDEMSMVGQVKFYFIDRRLRQITGKQTELFGGLSIILVGDFAQFPPVCDTALWKQPSTTDSERKKKGYEWYKMFDTAVTLTKIFRQKGCKRFMEALARGRNCDWTESDWKLLQTRWPQQFSTTEIKKYDDLVRIFARNKSCNNYTWSTNSKDCCTAQL